MEQSQALEFDPNWTLPANQFKPETKLASGDVPSTMQLDSNNTLHFTEETTDEDIEKVSGKIKPAEAADLIWKFAVYKKAGTTPSPASQGVSFIVPRLMFETQGAFVFATPEIIFENFDWNIIEYAVPRLDENEFKIGESGKGFYIDIDGNRLKYRYAGNELFFSNNVNIDVWTTTGLVYWLDRKLQQRDIPQPQLLEWLRRTIEYLTETSKITLANLMVAKYALLNKLSAKIITVPDGAGLYEIPNTGLAITFDPGPDGFKEGDTFSFSATAPAATNGEVLAAIDQILDAKLGIEWIAVAGVSAAPLWAALTAKAEGAEANFQYLFFVAQARSQIRVADLLLEFCATRKTPRAL